MVKTMLLKIFKIFIKDFKKGIRWEIKYILASVLIMSYWFFIVSIPSITAFNEVGPYRLAQYDLFITGPLSEDTIKKLDKVSETIVKGKVIGNVLVCSSSRCEKLDVLIVDNLTTALRLTEINLAYAKELKGSEGAVIDAFTAGKLGAKIGDTLTIEVKNKSASCKVVGILYPTSVTRNRVLVDEKSVPKIANLFPGYSCVWLMLKDKSKENNLTRSLSKVYYVVERTDILRNRENMLKNFQNSTIMKVVFYGGLVVLLALIFKEMQVIFKSKADTLAVLMTLGVPKRTLATCLTLELAIKWILLVIPISFVLAKFYVENIIGLFMPLDSNFVVIVSILLVSSILLSFLVSYKLTKDFDLARVLSEV